jgi:NAD(P)-dependent dehydrogenase (short-subunit alcohol dehydrogenase family)
MGKLDGRVALVTGAGRNIGRAVALRLASEGADVVVNARSNGSEAEAVADEIRALGRRALPVIADVAESDQVEAMVAQAMETFGRVDLLLNVAAIRPHKPFLELTRDDWERVRGVILDGAIVLTQAVLRSMVEQRYGRVVFFVGDGAWAGGAERGHVSAAKMALVGLCRSLATEFAPHEIRLNVISPGRIDTTRDDAWYPGRPMDKVDGIPLGRLGDVGDIADGCLFLVSDDSRWMTGQTLHVNGGSAYF